VKESGESDGLDPHSAETSKVNQCNVKATWLSAQLGVAYKAKGGGVKGDPMRGLSPGGKGTPWVVHSLTGIYCTRRPVGYLYLFPIHLATPTQKMAATLQL